MNLAIVGCGIAGTASALMLARLGHSVSLFEQTPQVGPVGAGVLLQPSGQRVLERMGLLEELRRGAERIDTIHAVKASGGDLVHLRYGDLRPDLHGLGLHRGDLFSLLHGRLQAAGVTLHLGTRIVSAGNLDTAPTLRDAAGHTHGPFDLLILADGSRSALREACGLSAHVHEYSYGAMWAVADVAPVRRTLFQAARGTADLAGLLPVGSDRCSLFWGLKRDRFEPLLRRGFGAWRADVLKLMPTAESLLDRLGSLDAVRYVTYRHVHLPRASTGKVVAIGDAAHAMSPHLGQGVNLALQDAEALSAAIQQFPDVPSRAFAAYAASRRWSTRYYAAVTAFLTPFFQHDGTALGRMRDIALPLLSRFPPTRKMMLRTLCGRS